MGRLLALPANTKLGWKGLKGTNALAYFSSLLVTKKKFNIETSTLYHPTPVEPFYGTPRKGKLLSLPKNIRLGWKGSNGTNALAYFSSLLVSKNLFITSKH
jgi:hypothetical protein